MKKHLASFSSRYINSRPERWNYIYLDNEPQTPISQSLTMAQPKTFIIQHQMPKEAFLREVEEVGLGCSQGLGLATLLNSPGFSVFVLCTNRKFKLDPYNRMPTSLNFLDSENLYHWLTFYKNYGWRQNPLNIQENSVLFYCLKEKLSYNV